MHFLFLRWPLIYYFTEKEIIHQGFLFYFVPPVVSSHGHGMLIPTQVVAAWIYQVPVLAVEKVEFMGHSFRRIETRLAGVGDNAVFGTLYAAEHILKGYEPQVGDDVTGTLWLQASMESSENAFPGQQGPLM